MNSSQKVTVSRLCWGMCSIILVSAAWFVWSLPEDLKASRAELESSEQVEAIAKAYSRSSSLFSLLCVAGSFAAYKAIRGAENRG